MKYKRHFILIFATQTFNFFTIIMKKILFLFILSSIFFISKTFGQANSYTVTLNNITQTSNETLEFDVWIHWTGTNTAYLTFFEGGINFNYAGLANGGTLSASFVNGSADPALPIDQQTVSANIDPTSLQYRIYPSIITSADITIPLNSTGIRLGTFKITNTVPFAIGSMPNFVWNNAAPTATTTKTRVAVFIGASSSATNVTNIASHLVSGNPAMVNGLPIQLSDFEVESNYQNQVISWTTLSERDNDFFVLEHSTDGYTFSPLAYMPSKAKNGYSQNALDYEYINENPQSGINYYRLTQHDIDGKTSISSTIQAAFIKQAFIQLFPNPVKEYIHLQYESDHNAHVTIAIFDLQGRVVNRVNTTVYTGSQTLDLASALIPQGTYLLSVVENNKEVYNTLFSK
ncbi:MAG: T9SS type A sorting domain-containing protein [Chitinophagaceae bacterium]